MAATAAPALDVVGAVAFAPAGDLDAIAGFDRSPAAGPDAWSSAITLVTAWHQVYGLPLDVLTPDAQALVPGLDTGCSVHIDASRPWSTCAPCPSGRPDCARTPPRRQDERARAHLPG